MAEIKLEIKGMEELQKAIRKRPVMMHDEVSKIVSRHGELLATRTKQNMSRAYTGHKEGKKFVRPTGATKNSVDVQYKNAGMTAVVAPHTEYFPYLEYGTRFMSPRPTLKPAFLYQSIQFANALKKLMK